mgnify:CR=1 FL=1
MRGPRADSPRIDRRGLLRTASAVGAAGLLGGPVAGAQGSHFPFDADGEIRRGPTVVNGTVYVGTRGSVVHAVDAESATETWRFELDEIPAGAPCVVDALLFVGDLSGTVYAVDAATGDEVWRERPDTAVWNIQPDRRRLKVRTSPTVADGTVYVGTEKAVYALDAATGEKQWHFTVGGSAAEFVHCSSPTVVDGTVYIVRDHTVARLYALDAETSDVVWKRDVGGFPAWSSPTVADGRVVVGNSEGGVYAFDAASGEERWHAPTEEGVASSPTIANGRVFVGANDHHLYALDAASGDELWRRDLELAVIASPTVADGVVYIGSGTGTLHAFEAASGDTETTWDLPRGAWSSPIVADGHVYVGDMAGNLHRFGTSAGGASEGSRVELGTLGHHGDWRYADQSIRASETATATTTETATASPCE